MTKRDVSIVVRLTENEKATLEEKAKIADESLSSFVRKISLGYKIVPPKEIGIVQGEQLDLLSKKESFSSADKAIMTEFIERTNDKGFYTFDNDLNLKLKKFLQSLLEE